MKRTLLVTALFTTVAVNAFAQANQPFRMVVLPDSVTSKLLKFLQKKEKLDGTDYPIYVFNLVDSKDYKYKDGVYAFRLAGPHYRRRIFIVNNSNVYIFEDYYIDDLLYEFSDYIKKIQLTTRKKIIYLKAISRFLEEEYKNETSSIVVQKSALG